LEMYWVDVEGGAATLIVTPAGESVLIDTGMPGGRDPKRIVQAAKDAGVERIDHLVTTHFHIDHFGGAAEVAASLPMGAIYDNGIPEINPDNPADKASFDRSILPYGEIKANKRVPLKPGDEIPLKQLATGERIKIRCLGGMQKTVGSARPGSSECAKGQEKPIDSSDNANSLVLLLSYGKFDLFDGGDLTWNNEAKLVCPNNIPGTVDIYDVNHHGLDVSNNPLLVHALEPTVAIMSNGTSKGCGAETFATLKSTPSIKAIYQTHRNLRADSQNNTAPDYIANLEKDCQANYIKVTVADDTESFTVSIPAKNHSQVFNSR
jgi:competence protein ComEC